MREARINTATKFKIFMADATNPLIGKPGILPAAFIVYLTKDNSAEAVVTPTIVERGHGWYEVTPTTAHRNTLGENAWTFTATGAVDAPQLESVVPLETLVDFSRMEVQTAAMWESHPTESTFHDIYAQVYDSKNVLIDTDTLTIPYEAEGSISGVLFSGTLTKTATGMYATSYELPAGTVPQEILLVLAPMIGGTAKPKTHLVSVVNGLSENAMLALESPLFELWKNTKVVNPGEEYEMTDTPVVDPTVNRVIGYGSAAVYLNTKTIAGFEFIGLRVTGRDVPSTLLEPRFYDCQFISDITIGPFNAWRCAFNWVINLQYVTGSHIYQLVDCYADEGPAELKFTACTNLTTAVVRRWSGRLTITGMKEYNPLTWDTAIIDSVTNGLIIIDEMTGGRVLINSAGGAGILINATCTGGTVIVSGNPGVITDLSNGAVTIVPDNALINKILAGMGDIVMPEDIAAAVLLHDWTTITDAVPPRSMLNALRHIRNRWELLGKDKTVFTEDDTTVAYTTQVTVDPIGNITADTPDP